MTKSRISTEKKCIEIQVWKGNENCEPVVWKECSLVPKQMEFKVPKIDCFDAEVIPYIDFIVEEKVKVKMLQNSHMLVTFHVILLKTFKRLQ